MIKGKWAKFAHPDKAFDYAGDRLAKNWAKLHVGDAEPLPEVKRIGALVKQTKAPKAGDAQELSDALGEAWRAYHRGDFERAYKDGVALGAFGAVVACKALGIHANYLVSDAKDQLDRYAHVAELAESAIAQLPGEANAHYFRAFAYGRMSQLVPMAKALSQGLVGKVRESLDRTLKLAPQHAEAHLALAVYHAEIVSKVGGMLASLTYGAKAASAHDLLAKAIKLAPASPIVYLEQGHILRMLGGAKADDAAAAAYAKAAAIKPIEAMQALDVIAARELIE